MDYFILHPDYDTLSKYFTFQDSKEDFTAMHADGYVIELYWFDEEKIDQVTADVRQMLEEYNLSEHYDNFMFICLTALEKMVATLDDIHDESSREDALVQLANTLLIYENRQGKPIDASFKTFNSSFKATNQKLVLWLGKLLRQAVEQKTYPLNDIPFDTFNQLCEITDGVAMISKEKLEAVAERKPATSKNVEKRFITELCLFYLIPYLNGESELRKATDVRFTDDQLTFIYKLLVATTILPERYFDPDMDYAPKDYLRNYLMKYMRKVGAPVDEILRSIRNV